ncbi:MAG: hypothetical protein ACYCYF_09740, partial [Anaerolineae bacterium]
MKTHRLLIILAVIALFATVVMTVAAAGYPAGFLAAECDIDAGGANDEPGQKDLTLMCSSPATGGMDVAWDWDDIDWSGNNSGDACALYDTDNDGLVNNAVCVVINGSPATVTDTRVYSCGDDKPRTCTQPVALLPTGGTACAISTSSFDPFLAGNMYPQDTTASCFVDTSAFTGGVLLDVCSYPSQQPNSDYSDCILATPDNATLEVLKRHSLPGGTDPGKFNLYIQSADGVTPHAYAANQDIYTGTTSTTSLPGHTTYRIGETGGTGTYLPNYETTSMACVLRGTSTVVPTSFVSGSMLRGFTGARYATVALLPGQDVVCTIYNFNPVPNAVDLIYFTAVGGESSVALAWETASETDNIGFNLYRAEGSVDGPRVKLNSQIIASKAMGQPVGAAYDFTDSAVTKGVTYFYWLEDMDFNTGSTLNGPVSARLVETAAAPAPAPVFVQPVRELPVIGVPGL